MTSKVQLELLVVSEGPQFVPTIRIKTEGEPTIVFKLASEDIFDVTKADAVLKYSMFCLETLGLSLSDKWKSEP